MKRFNEMTHNTELIKTNSHIITVYSLPVFSVVTTGKAGSPEKLLEVLVDAILVQPCQSHHYAIICSLSTAFL